MKSPEKSAAQPYTLDELINVDSITDIVKTDEDYDRLFTDERLETGYNAIAQAVRGTVLDVWSGNSLIDYIRKEPTPTFQELLPPETTPLELRVRYLCILKMYIYDLIKAETRFSQGIGVGTMRFGSEKEQPSIFEREVAAAALNWAGLMVASADQETRTEIKRLRSEQEHLIPATPEPKSKYGAVIANSPSPSEEPKRRLSQWFANMLRGA